ncbi:BTB/POZ domain-containing protein 9-like [Oppia nitens]|uniref:BTB/POZ domain-containing protein 9-like n=1 Tax=Oppia nitens TaxID=1686743 RepID=UPI0023DB80F3|nr:BTB/POZ domain-containing protein 9-like [Oppia nitens]
MNAMLRNTLKMYSNKKRRFIDGGSGCGQLQNGHNYRATSGGSSGGSGGHTICESVMNLTDAVIANFSSLYLSTKFSDVTIKVDTESIAGHKSVLGSQSDFFERLFESEMLESSQREIELKETDPEVFKMLLKLAYCGRLDLHELADQSDIIRVFGLIQRYQFARFEEPFLAKIKSYISPDNVWLLLESSLAECLVDCQQLCLDYLDTVISTDLLSTSTADYFIDISVQTLKTFLIRDSLRLQEIDLFLLTKDYVDNNLHRLDESERQELIQCVRLSLIKYEDLLNVVLNSGLVPEKQIMDILKDKAVVDTWDKTNSLVAIRNRGLYAPNTELCRDQFRFDIVSGSVGSSMDLMSPMDIESFDELDGNNNSSNNNVNDWPFVLRFGCPLNVNYVEIKLSDKRGDRFSYRLEYSPDGVVWKPLVDFTKYTTANYQRLFFQPFTVQMFRMSGTHQFRMDATTKVAIQSIQSFSCCYNRKQYSIERIDGFITTPYWIRSSVQQRVYHDSNKDIAVGGGGGNAGADGGDADHNNQHHLHHTIKYYSRQISSSKPILVALDQPVMIDSFQFYLWDDDGRGYSYVVDVKSGDNEWTVLSDRSLDVCRALQTIKFSRRPISLVRVRPTKIHNVECNEFRVKKFIFPKE